MHTIDPIEGKCPMVRAVFHLAVALVAAMSTVLGGCSNGVEPEQLSPTCLARADFGDPAESPYVLPYPVGAAYEVAQGYCGSGPWSSHNERFAIDFFMPIGAPVVASRAGIVVHLIEEFDDSGMNDDSMLNYIIIQHEDGTAAVYAHLQQHSAIVQLGDTVATGELIANSGNSGFTDNTPHLHFELYSRFPYHWKDDSIPVTFRNAGGPLDERGGLQYGVTYTALPW
jgi:murein DD-endopeptidase MepM/ murein hydrolase activator NlpD